METLPRTGYAILIAFALFGCHTPQKEKATSDTVTVATPILKETKNQIPKTNSLDYDRIKVIRQVFVIMKQGIPLREATSEQANILGHAEYGEMLDVVEDLGDWIAVRGRIGRNYVKDDGTRVESSGWEKVYVARNETGTLDEIQLTQSDLNMITSTNINQKSDFFEKGKPLTTHLRLELINQSVFETQKSNIVDFLLADTNVIIKKNGITTLPTANKPVKIKDKPGEEDREEYKYFGQIEHLNQYLVEGSYYESHDFKFFDKTSGKETQVFADYPHISSNRKNIISIYGNPYDST
ncbi:SH3 domain-containing protein [Pedobacter petrophilus]|uniref:SH3 domain-containing protein n=1 Tax=Pedobacter petrophilus TaxID=1908241 RepID=A0A7K0G0Q3_9SPHI|nr:SH3 domain-containing protein [Pedobacter petrophilus]MRX76566.1 SH3 domain-containing protein [Pedobacter petrophilus]